jgi:Glycosyl transferase family 2
VTIVMTLLVRDERDVVEQHLDFHLAAGVDVVVVTDHASADGTSDVLARYARDGRVHVIRRADGPFRQREWVTHMARLAATEHRADWVITSDADEFWWPRGGSLAEVLGSIPRRYGVVQSFVRHFVPVPDDGRPFQERMTLRLAPDAPINDPRSPWRPFRKVVHRAHPDARVVEGSHSVTAPGLVPMRGWYPLEVLHFPMRTPGQLERKGALWGSAIEKFYGSQEVAAGPGAAYHALAFADSESGRSGAVYEQLAGTDGERSAAVASGELVEDVRLRDALRRVAAGAPLVFARPSPADDAGFAVDAAILGEADLVRVRRRLDELSQRVSALEARPSARLGRRLRSAVRRGR